MSVYYSTKEREWVSVGGEAVCQDHGNLQPCPYKHGRGGI